MKVSVVTPTFFRHEEIPGYLTALEKQSYLPYEVILVDGAPETENRTQLYLEQHAGKYNLNIRYFRAQGGTAVQRNYGIDRASGDLIAFVDDDVRLDAHYLSVMVHLFSQNEWIKVGGIGGVRTNNVFELMQTARWRWYKRLNLLSVFEAGKYDYKNGYPVNVNAHPAFDGWRSVDVLSTSNAVYRAGIFNTAEQLRFDPFFIGYGVLEDAHLSLTVKKKGWEILQAGNATCTELNSSSGRTNRYKVGQRTCINYYYVFKSICGPLSFAQKWRFFRFQLFELLRAFVSIFTMPGKGTLMYAMGKFSGIIKSLL